jgi:hypothetical protein
VASRVGAIVVAIALITAFTTTMTPPDLTSDIAAAGARSFAGNGRNGRSRRKPGSHGRVNSGAAADIIATGNDSGSSARARGRVLIEVRLFGEARAYLP